MPASMTYASLVSSIESYLERETDTSLIAEIPTFVLFGQRRIARELKMLGLQRYLVATFTASDGVITKPEGWLETLSINFGSSSGTAISVDVNDGGSEYVAPLTFTSTGGGFTTQPTYEGVVINGVITQVAVATPGVGGTSAPTLTVAGFGSTGSGATFTVNVSTTNTERNLLLERSYEYCTAYWPNRALTGTPKFYADYDFNHWLVVPTPASAAPFEVACNVVDDLLDDSTQTNWLTQNAPDLLLYACLLETATFLKDDPRVPVWQGYYDRAATAFKGEDVGRFSDRTAKRGA